MSNTNVPQDSHCQFFVKRKRRYCRMTVKKGNKYCGEHQHQQQQQQQQDNNEINLIDKNCDNTVDNKRRIKCPLDPTHSCFEKKLEKHLKVCNAKRLNELQEKFVIKGVNIGDEMEEIPKHIPLSQLEQSQVENVIKKVNAAYDSLPEFPTRVLQHEVLELELKNPLCGKETKRHLLQNSSLLAHLESAGLAQNDTCYIEFGAGRGKLTYWMAQVVKTCTGSCILLIDRSSHRHKNENKLQNEQFPLPVKRVRADIADVCLNKISDLEKLPVKKVGIAKHLCGAATDLTIRCLVKAAEEETKTRVSGLVIAFCCHHRCEFRSYVGKEFLKQSGFTNEEFPILCSIASWATCGYQNQTQSSKEENESTNVIKEERKNIGRKVKCLLNWGRVEFLKSVGFETKLYFYTSSDVSLENMCIVATR